MDLEKQQQALSYKQHGATNSNGNTNTGGNGGPDYSQKSYAAKLLQATKWLNNGYSPETISENLSYIGTNEQDIADILNQLGIKKE